MERRMTIFGISFVLMVSVLVSINSAPNERMPTWTRAQQHWNHGEQHGTRSPQIETTDFELKWTKRKEWRAEAARQKAPVNGSNVPFVIIHHTATRKCQTREECKALVRSMQRTHMVDRGWDDIGYNFLIGGSTTDSIEIYEGRGFNISGAHTFGYNQKSLGIALIGNWTDALPPRKMLDVLRQLINYGVQKGYIEEHYSLLGHRQTKATECPGTALFNELKQWNHFKDIGKA